MDKETGSSRLSDRGDVRLLSLGFRNDTEVTLRSEVTQGLSTEARRPP